MGSSLPQPILGLDGFQKEQYRGPIQKPSRKPSTELPSTLEESSCVETCSFKGHELPSHPAALLKGGERLTLGALYWGANNHRF